MTIPGRVAMRLCCELLAALDFVHKLELVHCDVKPGNILLDGEGSLLLSDLARSSPRAAPTRARCATRFLRCGTGRPS